MRLEATLSRDDLTGLLTQSLPFKLKLGDNGAFLRLSDPDEITLVPDAGLRLTCKADLSWPVLGIDVPVHIHTLTVLLRPSIRRDGGHDVLVFRVELQHADLAGMPAILDARITERINRELTQRRIELIWDFTRTLTLSFALPDTLAMLDSLALGVKGGSVDIDEHSLRLSVEMFTSVRRSPVESLASSGKA